MANKGIIVFDRNIDVEKTQENGKKVHRIQVQRIEWL